MSGIEFGINGRDTEGVPSSTRTPPIFYLLWALFYAAFILAARFLLQAMQLQAWAFFMTMPLIPLSQSVAVNVCTRLEVSLHEHEVQTLHFVAPDSLTPKEAQLRAKPLSWVGLFWIVVGLIILAQAWNLPTMIKDYPVRLVFIVLLAAVSGVMAVREQQGIAYFTRVNEEGIIYSRGWKQARIVPWPQIARVEQVVLFDKIHKRTSTAWKFWDASGQPLLSVSPYSSSPEQQHQFTRVVERYLPTPS